MRVKEGLQLGAARLHDAEARRQGVLKLDRAAHRAVQMVVMVGVVCAHMSRRMSWRARRGDEGNARHLNARPQAKQQRQQRQQRQQ